jgi:CTP:molybdopterin cytidylyltransferase MocA
MKTAGLITAAGLSSRMGSPKPLLPVDGKTFILHILDTFRAAGADPVVVITGHEAARLEAALAGTGAVLLRNERYAETDIVRLRPDRPSISFPGAATAFC